MTTEHHALTPAEVWILLSEGFNAEEIRAYAGVSLETANAMISRASRMFAMGEAA